MIFRSPADSVEGARLQFHRHERIVRHTVFGVDPEARGRQETEARVIRRVAEDDDACESALSELSALFEAPRMSAEPIPKRWCSGTTAIGASPTSSRRGFPESETGEKRM